MPAASSRTIQTIIWMATALLAAVGSSKIRAGDTVPGSEPKATLAVVEDRDRPWEYNDGTVEYRGCTFRNWRSYLAWRLASEPFSDHRCGTPSRDSGLNRYGVEESDCGIDNNVPLDRFDPSNGDYVIPVVVHVIRDSTGELGDVSEERIIEQIRILNAVFAGPVGEYGSSQTGIRFMLSRRTPDDSPSDGYTFHNNDEWYNDRGEYWKEISWDPDRYLNIYTNTGGSAFGYVPNVPASGIAG